VDCVGNVENKILFPTKESLDTVQYSKTKPSFPRPLFLSTIEQCRTTFSQNCPSLVTKDDIKIEDSRALYFWQVIYIHKNRQNVWFITFQVS
jgi:hypothetical protein